MNCTPPQKIRFRTGLWLLLLTFPLLAEVQINSNVDRSEMTIGDKITYTIDITYPEEGKIELPAVLGNLGQFEVKDYETSDPQEAGKKQKQQTWTFVLSTFTVGEYVIPPQIVEFYPSADDTAAQRFNTEPIKVLVNRTSAENVKDIAPITDLAPMPGRLPWVWILLIAGVVLGGLGIFIWLRTRRNKKISEVEPRKPPYEEAMANLHQLQRENLIAKEEARLFGFRLSEILRMYVSRRFLIEALESTTEEFLEKIHHIGITQAQRESLQTFCGKIDPVKFANLPLSSQDADNLWNQVKTFVEETRPRETTDKNNAPKREPGEKPTSGEPSNEKQAAKQSGGDQTGKSGSGPIQTPGNKGPSREGTP